MFDMGALSTTFEDFLLSLIEAWALCQVSRIAFVLSMCDMGTLSTTFEDFILSLIEAWALYDFTTLNVLMFLWLGMVLLRLLAFMMLLASHGL